MWDVEGPRGRFVSSFRVLGFRVVVRVFRVLGCWVLGFLGLGLVGLRVCGF